MRESSRQLSTAAVIGLGTMGAGIVEVLSRGGLRVVGVETTAELAERGRGILRRSTDKAVARGKLDEAGQREILDRVSISTDLADLADVDLVIEAVPEVLALKHEVIGRLDEVVREDAIIATNTSSLSITAIAGPTRHPERVLGMHFFNPAPVLRLVEVITTVRTDPEVTAAVVELTGRLGKKPVVVGDRAGFVANYLLFGYFTAALRMLETGHVSREDLDTAMRVGAGLPMGPLTLVDLVGLDVCHHIGDVIYAHSRSRRHAPSPLLERMVTAGLLGRKNGRGFYTYGEGGVVPDALTPAPAAPSGLTDVGVVGAGEVADDLVTRLRDAGYAVRQVTEDGDADALAGLAGVGLVVEARTAPEPPEDLEDDEAWVEDAGADLWESLAGVVGEGTVLTTVNPDSAAALGAMVGRPGQTAVLRVHAPTAHGQVVEIGRSSATSEATVALLREVVGRIGAEPVVCRDRTGLVVDALLMPHLNDAVVMLDEGYASAEDIDTALQHGLGYPVGPFAMIDQIGADEVLAVCEDLRVGTSGLPVEGVEPSPLLVEHVLLDRPFTAG